VLQEQAQAPAVSQALLREQSQAKQVLRPVKEAPSQAHSAAPGPQPGPQPP